MLHGDPRGFSILELLVAVSILALSIVPMLANQGSNIRNTGRLHESVLAQIVAENIVTQYTVMPLETVGVISGQEEQGGQVFPWRGAIQPQRGEPIFVVRVDVLHPESGKVLFQLRGLRRDQENAR